MPTTVQVDGIGNLEFPDGMSEADMSSAIKSNFPQLFPQPTPVATADQSGPADQTHGASGRWENPVPQISLLDPIGAIGTSANRWGDLAQGFARDVLQGNVLPNRGRIIPNLENTSAAFLNEPQPALDTETGLQKAISTGARMLPDVLEAATTGGFKYAFPVLQAAKTWAETHNPFAAFQSGAIQALVPPIWEKAGELTASGINALRTDAKQLLADTLAKPSEFAASVISKFKKADAVVKSEAGMAAQGQPLMGSNAAEFVQKMESQYPYLRGMIAQDGSVLGSDFLSKDRILKAVETLGSSAGVSGYLEAVSTPQLLEMTPEERNQSMLDTLVGGTLFSAAMSAPEIVRGTSIAGQSAEGQNYATDLRNRTPSNQRQYQGTRGLLQSEGIDRNVAPVEPASSTAPGGGDLAAQGGRVAPEAVSPSVTTVPKNEPIVPQTGTAVPETPAPVPVLAPSVEQHLQQLGVPRTAPVEVVTAAVQKLITDAQKTLNSGGEIPPELSKELGVIELLPDAKSYPDGTVRVTYRTQDGKEIGYGQLDGKVINMVSVAEPYRRQGVGSAIIADLRDRGGLYGVAGNPGGLALMRASGAREYEPNKFSFEAPVAEPPPGKVEVLPPVQTQPAPQPEPPKQAPPIAPPAQRRTVEMPFDIVRATKEHAPQKLSLDYAQNFQKSFKPVGVAREVFTRKGGRNLDDVLDGFHREGLFLNIRDEQDYLDALNAVSGQRKAFRGEGKREGQMAKRELDKTKEFTSLAIKDKKARRVPSEEYPVSELLTGDQFKVDGSNFIVKELVFDPETTELSYIIAEDGSRFGVQMVEGNASLHLDKGSLIQHEPSTEFLDPQEEAILTKEAPPSPSVTATGPLPKLRRGEKQGDVFANQEEPLALVGEKGKDYEKLQKEALDAAKRKAEAAAIAAANQRPLFGSPVPVPLGTKPVDSQYIIDQALRSGGGDAALRTVVPQLRIRYGPLGEGVPMDYENGVITINKPLLDMIAARWPYQSRNYIERLFSEELIHAVADRVVPSEDYVAIAQNMSPKEVSDLLRDRPDIDATINLGQRLYQMGGEHFRRVLQRELMGETTEEALPRIDAKTPLGQRIIAALRRVWEYLRELVSRLGTSPNFVLNQALETVRQTLTDLEAGKPLKPLPLDQGTDLGPLNANSIKEAIRTFAEKPNALETMRVAQAGEVVAANPAARRMVEETQALARGPEKSVRTTTGQERMIRDIAQATLNQPIVRNQLVGPIDTLNIAIQLADGDLADFERVRNDPQATDDMKGAAAGNAEETLRAFDTAAKDFAGEYINKRTELLSSLTKYSEEEFNAMERRDVDETLFEQFRELGRELMRQTADVAGLKSLNQAISRDTATVKVLKFLRETGVLDGLAADDNRSVDDLVGYIRDNIVSNPARFPNYDGSTFDSQVTSAVGVGMEGLRDVLRIVRLSEPLRTDIAAAREMVAGRQYAQPFNKIKQKLLDDLTKGNLDNTLNLFERGIVETGITLKESRDAANFYARKTRQALVSLKALDGANAIISQLQADPVLASQRREVYQYLNVRNVVMTIDGTTINFEHALPTGEAVPIKWDGTVADYDANQVRARRLLGEYMAYIGEPDATGYDAGRAAGMRIAAKYLEFFTDPAADIRRGHLLQGSLSKTVNFLGSFLGHPELVPKYAMSQAVGPLGDVLNLTAVAMSDVLERTVAIEQTYRGRRHIALATALQSHGDMRPGKYRELVFDPLAASRQNFNDVRQLKVGDGIGNGYRVTSEDIAYLNIARRWQNEEFSVVNNYGKHKFESISRIFAGILFDSNGKVRFPYAHGQDTTPRRFPSELVDWFEAWTAATTPEAREQLLNRNLTKLVVGYVDGVLRNDYKVAYTYRLPLKEIARTMGDEPIKSFTDLVNRVTDLHNADTDIEPLTAEQVRDTMLEEIGAALKRGNDLATAKPKSSAKFRLEVIGGDSEYNTPREQAIMPPGWYSYGVVTDAEVAGALRGASLPFINAHLDAAEAFVEGLRSDIRKFEDEQRDFPETNIKARSAAEMQAGERLYSWGEAEHLREIMEHYLAQLQAAVKLSATPYLADRAHQSLTNPLAKAVITSLVAGPKPVVNNLIGGFIQVAAFNAELRALSAPAALAVGGKQLVAGTFKELLYLATHPGNPITRSLRTLLENPQTRSLMGSVAQFALDAINERQALRDYTAEIGVNLNERLNEQRQGAKAFWRTRGVVTANLPRPYRQYLNWLALRLDNYANFVGHATVGYADARLNGAGVYIAQGMEKRYREIALRWGDKRLPNGLYPDKALTGPKPVGGETNHAQRIRQAFRQNAIGPIDKIMGDYYEAVTAARAEGKEEPASPFTPQQVTQMAIWIPEDTNLATARSRPLMWKTAPWLRKFGVLLQWGTAWLQKLLDFTKVMSNQGFLRRFGGRIPLMVTVGILIALLATVSVEIRAHWISRVLENKVTGFPTLSDATSPAQAATAIAAAAADSIPVFGDAFNMITGTGFKRGFDINSQFLLLNFAGDVMKTSKEIYQSGDVGRPLLQFANRYVYPLSVVGSRLPAVSGLRDLTNARNILTMGARGTGLETKLRKPGGGITEQNYTASTPLINDAVNAIGNGDQEGFQKAYNALVEQKRAGGSLNPQSAALTALKARNPITSVFGTKPDQAELDRVFANLPSDLASRARDTVNRFDSAIAALPRKTAARTMGTRTRRSAKPASFGLRRPKIRLASIHLRRSTLRRLAA